MKSKSFRHSRITEKAYKKLHFKFQVLFYFFKQGVFKHFKIFNMVLGIVNIFKLSLNLRKKIIFDLCLQNKKLVKITYYSNFRILFKNSELNLSKHKKLF